MGHDPSVQIGRGARLASAAIDILAFAACSGDPNTGEGAPDTSGHETGASSPQQICLAGVHRTPVWNVRVERAVAAQLSAVKKWVLEDPSIDWATFSSTLATAPLDERVGVCVYSKVDGTSFRIPGTESAESVLQIVRANGEATLFVMGSTDVALETTPKSFPSHR